MLRRKLAARAIHASSARANNPNYLHRLLKNLDLRSADDR